MSYTGNIYQLITILLHPSQNRDKNAQISIECSRRIRNYRLCLCNLWCNLEGAFRCFCKVHILVGNWSPVAS
jgi:hypothetical protein